MVMKPTHVSKSRFKAQALEFFRTVEQSGQPIIITDRGEPVLKLMPFAADVSATLEDLRGTVVEYREPMDPVGVEDWETL
jgi:prevent-host-death family protein